MHRFVLGSEERPALDKCDGDNSNCGVAAAGDNGSCERPIGTPPEPPMYMTVRVDRRKRRKRRKFENFS